MTKPLTRSEVAALADALGNLLAAVDRYELTASTSMRHRFEGARMALEAVQGHPI